MKRGSSKINLEQVLQEISENQVRPVYLISGTEEYLVFDARKTIVNALKSLKKVDQEDYIDQEKTTPAEIVLKLKSPSLFNPYQIIVVRNVPWFTADKISLAEPFKEWATAGLSNSTLIMTTTSIDRRLGVVKKIASTGGVLTFDKVRNYNQGDIRRDSYYPIVRDRLAPRQQSFEPDAWQMLRQRTSDDLWNVINAVDVVSAYAGTQQRITTADVNVCVQDHSEMPGYMVLEAMGKRDPLLIKQCLEKSLMAGSPGLVVTKTISNRIRALLLTHSLQIAGKRLPSSYSVFQNSVMPKIMPVLESHPVAARQLAGMKPYALFMLLKQSNQFQPAELTNCLKKLTEIDFALKSGSQHQLALLESALLPFCRNRRR